MRFVWVLVGVLAGCRGVESQPSVDGGNTNGVLVLEFEPIVPTAPNLALTQAKVRYEGCAVFGDVTPDARTMLSSYEVDMFGGLVSHTFDQAPQGLYSRVHAKIDDIAFQGTYRGMQIQAQIDYDGLYLDVRDPVGEDVAPGKTAIFDVGIDGPTWFEGINFDTAIVSGGNIVIDQFNNTSLGMAIASNVVRSMALKQPVAPH